MCIQIPLQRAGKDYIDLNPRGIQKPEPCKTPHPWELFSAKQIEYNMRTKNLVILSLTRTQAYEVNSVTFGGSIIWNAFTDNMKTSVNVAAFKKKTIAEKRGKL